jgi:alpha-glucosidase
VFTSERLESKGQSVTWPVKLDDLPVLVRGGSVVPLHQGGTLSSAAARKTPFDVVVALSTDGVASGQLYLDDGEHLDGIQKASIVAFKVETTPFVGTTFTSQVGVNQYADAATKKINKLVVLGVTKAPKSVVVNDSIQLTAYAYAPGTHRLEIDLSELSMSVIDKLSVSWDAQNNLQANS